MTGFMRRVACSELLDQDQGTSQEIEASLDDLWRFNRWLGGISGYALLLKRFFERTGPHPVRILDVGSGDTRLVSRVRRELAKRGLQADFFVLDRRLSHLRRRLGLEPRLAPVVADVLAPPFGDGSFEVVTCNLLLHHFSGANALEFLRHLAALASEAVLVNDLERAWLPYLFVRLTPWLMRSRITRHDAPASVRQAYTRREVTDIARSAGFAEFDVIRLPVFRLGLVLWRRSGIRKS